jgi:hypothetical protein
MAIPGTQLDAWSHQGSVTQSKATYGTIRGTLEERGKEYYGENVEVFLQGSYGNDTNVYAESDVDIVILYNNAFFHNADELDDVQRNAFKSSYSDSAYGYHAFREHVRIALQAGFGNNVKPGKKAIKIAGSGSRRNADVVPAFVYKKFFAFKSPFDQNAAEGIAFYTSDNKLIVNYPKQHSENCTRKHQNTGMQFKPLVRIFKNIRNKLVEEKLIKPGDAPSYFVEGLLYNVPDFYFYGGYENIVSNILMWLQTTPDRSKFVCANERYYLLRDDEAVCWPVRNGEQFINATIALWSNWQSMA